MTTISERQKNEKTLHANHNHKRAGVAIRVSEKHT